MKPSKTPVPLVQGDVPSVQTDLDAALTTIAAFSLEQKSGQDRASVVAALNEIGIELTREQCDSLFEVSPFEIGDITQSTHSLVTSGLKSIGKHATIKDGGPEYNSGNIRILSALTYGIRERLGVILDRLRDGHKQLGDGQDSGTTPEDSRINPWGDSSTDSITAQSNTVSTIREWDDHAKRLFAKMAMGAFTDLKGREIVAGERVENLEEIVQMVRTLEETDTEGAKNAAREIVRGYAIEGGDVEAFKREFIDLIGLLVSMRRSLESTHIPNANLVPKWLSGANKQQG